MGSKYTTQTASGYNSSPPSDDGSQTASNLVKWATHKSKLADPIKNLTDAINTALVTAMDYSVRQITTSDSVAASDHMKTVEIAPNATTGVTVTLGTASTMTNNFIVRIKNSSAFEQTVARQTSDTIDGSAANIKIPSKSAFTFSTTTGADGYLLIAAYPLEISLLTEDTAPAVSDLVATYDLSANQLKKSTLKNLVKSVGQPTRQVLTSGSSATYTTPTGATRINVRMIGGGGGGGGSGGAGAGAGGAGGDTSFSTLTAGGGAGGAASGSATGGSGGTASNGDINISGSAGAPGQQSAAGTNNNGGTGGASLLGGSGKGGTVTVAGSAGATNSGGGGGGAGGNGGSAFAGGGGGSGAYVEKVITSPASSYTYTVGSAGSAGSAGTSGLAGGAGGSGIIIVDEFYN